MGSNSQPYLPGINRGFGIARDSLLFALTATGAMISRSDLIVIIAVSAIYPKNKSVKNNKKESNNKQRIIEEC